MRIRRYIAGFFQCVVLVLSLTACGGGGGSDPPPPAPSATTTDANPVSNDNAVLNGEVIPNGLATTAWFEYGTDPSLVTFIKAADNAVGSGTTPVSVSQPIFGLTAGTAYYFRVTAQNSAGISTGTIESFAASLLPPTVSTTAANPVSNDNATLNGDVDPKGLATEAWFEWGTDPALNGFTTTAHQPVGSGTVPVPVDCAVLNLSPGTIYYFRVAASNSEGTSRGTIENFKASQIPSATTDAATSVTSDNATLNGRVNTNGLQTDYRFVWGTDPNLTNPALTHETSTVGIPAGTFTTQTVNAQLSGLTVGTTYYFRLVAGNAEGESQGAIRSFRTSASPTVTTNAATDITTTSAVLNGNVNPNGFATETWFEYGTDNSLSSPPTTRRSQGSSTTSIPFSEPVSGLTPWRTYYYRAAASNTDGTGSGVIRTFSTGDYYVAIGDSITLGSHDTIISDGIGYEPILNNLLTDAKGYPHTVINAGASAETSSDGANRIAAVLSANTSAKYFLILYGTNDAIVPAVSKATYKSNMQAIISAIKNAGKIPYLAKVPYVDPTNPSFPAGLSFSDGAIRQYNQAIDELVADPLNGISIVPPDFYGWFQSHTNQLDDGLHPNGSGYQSMADLWFTALP